MPAEFGTETKKQKCYSEGEGCVRTYVHTYIRMYVRMYVRMFVTAKLHILILCYGMYVGLLIRLPLPLLVVVFYQFHFFHDAAAFSFPHRCNLSTIFTTVFPPHFFIFMAGRLGLFYGNKCNSPLMNFTSKVKFPGGLGEQLVMQVKPVASTLESGAQVQQLLTVECRSVFTDQPRLMVNFR